MQMPPLSSHTKKGVKRSQQGHQGLIWAIFEHLHFQRKNELAPPHEHPKTEGNKGQVGATKKLLILISNSNSPAQD